jgi:TRAP-type C4-dicarboxylate transport system permease small subunit
MDQDAAHRHEDSAAHVADLDPEAPRPSEEAELGGESQPELLPNRQPWRSIFHAIGVVEQVIGSVLLVIILVLVLGQVAARYVPGSWVWTGEVARLSMVWLTLVMAGYLAAHDRHIAIHVVDWVLAGRALAAVKLFVSITVLVTCLVLLYAVYLLIATDIGGVTPAAEIPLRFVNAVPLVGFALVVLRALLSIVLVDLPALIGRAESRS